MAIDERKLRADIEELEEAIARSQGLASPTEERPIDAQVQRLQAVVARLENELERIERSIEVAPHTAAAFEQKRRDLMLRIDRIDRKIMMLRDQRNAADPEPEPAETPELPDGVEARLRQRLVLLVRLLRTDAHVPATEIKPLQQRASALVRSRRARLDTVVSRLRDARQYLVSFASRMDELGKKLPELPEESIGEQTFFAERQEVALKLDMAAMAVKEARQELDGVARQWPELNPLVALPDWRKLPIHAAKTLVQPGPGTSFPATRDGIRAQLHEARQTSAGLSLWLKEISQRIKDAPMPVNG